MPHYYHIFLILFSLFNAATEFYGSEGSPIPEKTKQIILVLTSSDTSLNGKLYRFERSSDENDWRRFSGAIRVVVGRNGLGWGKGLHPSAENDMPVKRERDGKSPAGVFFLEAVFGFKKPAELKTIRMPYRHVTELLECVDDPESRYYNQLISRKQAESPDWNSSEKMWEIREEYEFGVVVGHNMDPVKLGAGSCIFLHIWGGPLDPTSGCTAMSRKDLLDIIYWLDSENYPVLVQLTENAYLRLKTPWSLPDIK